MTTQRFHQAEVQERLLLPCQGFIYPSDGFRVKDHARLVTYNCCCCCWVELWVVFYRKGLEFRMSTRCPICASNAASSTAATSAAPCPLADDWANGERMAFLTSRIAPGDVNARDQMVRFWSKATQHAFEEASSLSLDLGVLSRSSLAWGGATAPGVELGMADMLTSGDLLRRSNLEEEAGLARRLIVAPLAYLFGAMGLGGSASNVCEGQHLHRYVLESLVERVVAYCQQLLDGERTVYLHADSLMKASGAAKPNEQQAGSASPWCWEMLCHDAAASSPRGSVAFRMLRNLASDDCALLAAYMVKTKRAVREDGMLKIVTVSGGGGDRGEAIISETDRDLLRLRSSIASLQACTLDLGKRIQGSRLEALRENRQGQKRAALVHMRRMKQFQTARDSRMSSLYTLETSLDQVKQLRMDKQVLAAHEAATSALKACREAQGLTVELVEDTLDAFAEEMAAQQAIGAAIAQENTLLEDMDEKAELEAELDALLRGQATATTVDSTPPTPSVATDSSDGVCNSSSASAHSRPSAARSVSADGVSVDGSSSGPARPSREGRIAVPF